MRNRMTVAIAFALMLTLSMAGMAAADPPTAQTDVSLEITEGSEFSVAITNSNDFPTRTFSLGAPGNYAYSAFYNVQVTDMRGTGDGWDVIASASAFDPAVPGSGLPTVNNGPWATGLTCTPTPAGFCSSAGSIDNGVSVVAGSPDIIAAPASIFTSATGMTPAPQPFGTGVFSTQEIVYYTGFPNALAVGTYTTTVLLTLQSGVQP